MTKKEQNAKLGQIISRAWADAAFKQRLLADATTVFKEEGLPVPDGIEVKVVENSDSIHHLVIPQQPANKELSTDDLLSMSGGIMICPYEPCGHDQYRC